jgi:hypothetical protein
MVSAIIAYNVRFVRSHLPGVPIHRFPLETVHMFRNSVRM